MTGVALAVAAPYLTVIVMSKVNQTIFINAQKKLDAIEESQSFTEHNILKERLSLTHTPIIQQQNLTLTKFLLTKLFLEMDLN